MNMKERFFRVLKKYVGVLGIGILYFVFIKVTKIGIPCPFRLITGFQCPGCGLSRLCVALIQLDFAAAFQYNPFIFITAPILCFIIFFSDYLYIKKGDSSLGKWNILLILELIGLLVFGVLRNIV